MASKRKRTHEWAELDEAAECVRDFRTALFRKAEAEEVIKESESLVEPRKRTYNDLICSITAMASASLMKLVNTIEELDMNITNFSKEVDREGENWEAAKESLDNAIKEKKSIVNSYRNKIMLKALQATHEILVHQYMFFGNMVYDLDEMPIPKFAWDDC